MNTFFIERVVVRAQNGDGNFLNVGELVFQPGGEPFFAPYAQTRLTPSEMRGVAQSIEDIQDEFTTGKDIT